MTLTDEIEVSVDTVKRTACCGSVGGKKVGGKCFVCGASDPDEIWVAVTGTENVLPYEEHRFRVPDEAGGYVPRAAEDPFASTGAGRKSADLGSNTRGGRILAGRLA